MADGRMLAKKISLNEAVASLENDMHRLLFTWGLSHLDIEGRISGSPKVFRAIVSPLLEHITSEKVSKFFKDAEAQELIFRYQVGKDWFIEYPKFKENQRLRPDREAPSKLPSPPDLPLIAPGELPECSGTAPALSLSLSSSQEKLSLREDIASPDNGDARPLPLAFSCECFEITPEYLRELCQTFPLLPEPYLLKEFFPKMRNWCLDNRKASKHLKKFDSKGHLKNPRSCFSKWLKNEDPARAEGYLNSAARADAKDPFNVPGLLKLDPDCPLCHGDWRNSKEPCSCLHPVEDDNAKPEPKRTAPPATC